MVGSITSKKNAVGTLSDGQDESKESFELPASVQGEMSSAEGAQESQQNDAVVSENDEKSKLANSVVSDVATVTKDPSKREELRDVLRPRRRKHKAHTKRRAVSKTIEDAGNELDKKVKVRLVKRNRRVRLKTKTGEVVSGGLKTGEQSKVLVGKDGSKVLLLDKKLGEKDIVKTVADFTGVVISENAERNGLEIDDWFISGLADFLAEFVDSTYGMLIATSVLTSAIFDTYNDKKEVAEFDQRMEASLIERYSIGKA